MIRPNFFIAGAPKCGTTALFEYLKGHPRIFLPATKEPGHFLRDTELDGIAETYRNRDDYLRLFASARGDQAAVGEATVWYLFCDGALEQIREFDPSARIIVLIRPYVEYLYSLHNQLVFNRWEDASDFGQAWGRQESRRRGDGIPAGCPAPAILQYASVGRLGEQVQRAGSIFPRRQIKIVKFEDLVSDPRSTYRSVLDFLEVPDDGRTDFPRINANRVFRFPSLGAFYNDWSLSGRRAWFALKKRLGLGNRLQVGPAVVRFLSKERARPPLGLGLRSQVNRAFEADVRVLSRVVGEDLSGYLGDRDTGGSARAPLDERSVTGPWTGS